MRYLNAYCLSIALVLATSLNAFAWNGLGHRTVARIAWDNLTPTTRSKVVKILKQAAPSTGIRTLRPKTPNLSQAEKDRELFVAAATWPDLIRGDKPPFKTNNLSEKNKWHYINKFWQESGSGPKDLPALIPPIPNVVLQLTAFNLSLASPKTVAAAKAEQIAWVLHLVGDIHQPLHTSARVTSSEPQGDRGGNDFCLAPAPATVTACKNNNLHGYWDGILSLTFQLERDPADPDKIALVESKIIQAQPRSNFPDLKAGQFDEWANEGFEVSKNEVYSSEVVRNKTPSESYRKKAYAIAETKIALAGYRLADMLNRIFG
jgi:S1/P1 Nuclease